MADISSTTAQRYLTDLGFEELQAEIEAMGGSRFRTKQVLDWMYDKRADSFEAMTNLSREFQLRLAERFQLQSMRFVRVEGSADTTRKFLFRLHDGRLIETVLIPASPALYGSRSDRHTLCVSSQVGCAFDCKFCASGLAGFTRNLSAGEIVEQLLQVEAVSGKKVNNLVFMGMGEPLANYPNLLKAIEIFNAHWGANIGARHMTVSTSGLAPQIRKLADQPLQVRLAISLHGACDEVRERIMPVNRRFPLDTLFEALAYYRTKKKQKITLEYILIEGVNDDLKQAELLAKRARSLAAKVNLIPYNTVEGLEWKRPSEKQQEDFARIVHRAGVPVTLRREKGHDISAACGQLRLIEEATEASVS